MPLAHVKWFIENDGTTALPFGLGEQAVVFWLIAAISLLIFSFTINSFVKEPKKLIKWGKTHQEKVFYFFQALVALSLIFAATQEVILVPHYNSAATLWAILQIIAAVFLLLNRWVHWGAIVLLVSYLGASFSFGFAESIDYINVLGIVAFLILANCPCPQIKNYRKYALDTLRVLTGLALVILAFTEKLLAPEKATEFLMHYDINFMHAIGFESFTDRLFILSAGSMEAVFGLIMLLGFITRINTLALAVFLIASNVFFFTQGYTIEGWIELFGHLPVIGTAVLLIVYGRSTKILTK